MQHHTKTFGDLGVLKAKIDLLKKGFVTCTPDTEHSPFDLVAWKNNKCITVQVKARNKTSRGNIEVNFRSSWADKNGSHTVHVDKDAIDLYCVYCPQTELCYYFNPINYGKSITIRIDEAKNSQLKSLNWHEDFLKIPV
jgi:hypothetical protein